MSASPPQCAIQSLAGERNANTSVWLQFEQFRRAHQQKSSICEYQVTTDSEGITNRTHRFNSSSVEPSRLAFLSRAGAVLIRELLTEELYAVQTEKNFEWPSDDLM